MTRSRRRARFVPMAGPYVDPHTRPMTAGETIGTVVLAIEVVVCLVAAMILFPDQADPTTTDGRVPIVETIP